MHFKRCAHVVGHLTIVAPLAHACSFKTHILSPLNVTVQHFNINQFSVNVPFAQQAISARHLLSAQRMGGGGPNSKWYWCSRAARLLCIPCSVGKAGGLLGEGDTFPLTLSNVLACPRGLLRTLPDINWLNQVKRPVVTLGVLEQGSGQ